MENSRALAKVIGPTLCVMATSEMVNLHIWSEVVASLIYLNGIILFTTGLYIIRIHNSWKIDWTIFITLTAWLGMTIGLFRVFFPETKQLAANPFTYAILLGLIIVGMILTWKAYTSAKHTG
ncbi:hypothetical protein [Parachryseolinea silvisoli]|jgi:hypothetical protein|uniref:hypothetical protein n=1 Tax=Parachryseolinea silvisoli TaxID=2873601 RepID=UPI002265BD1F|nr:hypothetical protein [Parachryseolinea silvisoli]MCD9015137.1 hypothetical protein [Parachryseolinea silvisoli]